MQPVRQRYLPGKQCPAWFLFFTGYGRASGSGYIRSAAALLCGLCLVLAAGYIAVKLSNHQNAAAKGQETVPAKENGAEQEQAAGDGLLYQLFCPIVDLPALHGILIPKS